MKKGYWISFITKIENQENLKKYAEIVTPIIKSLVDSTCKRWKI